MHKEQNMYVPSLIFGHLLTSSNYDDSEKKVTGGRNGYGAKLCNIFSTKFIVETSSKDDGKAFKQVWTNNMGQSEEPIIKSAASEDFTRITFYPDLKKFGMTRLDDDIVGLFKRRAYDIAGCAKGVKVFLNGDRLPVKSFKDYISKFLEKFQDEDGEKIQFTYEEASERWQIAVAPSDKGFQQVSFVNSIATTKGGTHIEHVTEQIVNRIIENLKKKDTKKKSVQIKPFQVKSHLWVFANCLIENPSFDSQTKENMTLPVKNFGSKCSPSESFFKSMFKTGIMEKIAEWMKFKENQELKKKGGKKNRFLMKEKLIDAENAGGAHSMRCTLILTEGDSALNLFKTGRAALSKEQQKYYGGFPLRGKLLNVRDASFKQIKENKEIEAICQIVGLDFGKTYSQKEDLKSLRYGKIMIMADQDHDGSHIKGLIINFIHFKWPNLLKHDFLEEFITPICKATRGNKENEVKSFYSLPELEEWQNRTPGSEKWRIKYYKGLGTSKEDEAIEYFGDLDKHRIKFEYKDRSDDQSVELAFSKKLVEQRKEWLMNNMEERKRRREEGLAEDYLYRRGVRAVTYRDFVHKELVLFSNLDNERSIPSIMDGFKPTQRKVLFTMFKKKVRRPQKLNILSGSVIQNAAYHHGETSLYSTMGGLAQTFVGSNNLNLLMPEGQFGSRSQGGKDIAAARYIETCLNPIARKIFPQDDDPLLQYLTDDNQRVEPEFYVPIIPMVLVNGADGIGTGWSTKVPNYDPREIIRNLKRMIDGGEPIPMKPWYKGFKGRIEQIDSQRFVVFGEIAEVDSSDANRCLVIKELPVRVWTEPYKEKVLIPMTAAGEKEKKKKDGEAAGAKKTSKSKATRDEDDDDDEDGPATGRGKSTEVETGIRIESFVDSGSLDIQLLIRLNDSNLAKAKRAGIYKVFKLQTTFSTTSMVLFDNMGCLKRYDTPEMILRDFFEVRMDFYRKRKAYLLGFYEAEAKKLLNQCRFIKEKNDGVLKLERVKVKEMIQILIQRGYDSDPVAEWRKKNNYLAEKSSASSDVEDDSTNEEEEDELSETHGNYDFKYLLDMRMRSMLDEREKQLMASRLQKLDEIENLKRTSVESIYHKELDELSVGIDQFEKTEAEKLAKALKKKSKKNNDDDHSSKGKMSKKEIERELQQIAQARVIEPPVDMEAFKKKEPGVKKEKTLSQASKAKASQPIDPDATEIMEFYLSGDDESSLPMSQPMSQPGPSKKTSNGTKKPAKSAPKKTSTKPKKKKNSDSDDESDGGKEPFDFDDDSQEEIKRPALKVQKKVAASKKPAKGGKKRKSWESDGLTEDESIELSSDEEDLDDSPIKPRSPRTKRARKEVNYRLIDGEDEEEENDENKTKSDQDDDDDSLLEI